MPNVILASRFAERVERLLLGIQLMDAHRQQRIASPVEVRVEKLPALPLSANLTRWLEARAASRVPLSDSWPRVMQHASGRHAIHYSAGQGNSLDLRILDATQKFVPRRLRIPLTTLGTPEDLTVLDALPVGSRSRQPVLFGGAAYETNERATGLRGRVVVRTGASTRAVRWPRVEARPTSGGAPIAWAHGDANGEFLLLLPPESIAAPAVQLPRTLSLSVTAFGRLSAPSPGPPLPIQRADTHWDLPLETLGAPGIAHQLDLIALGRVVPGDFDGSATQQVAFSYTEIISSSVAPFVLT